MFGDVARRRPIKPRIIGDFDLSAKGAESGPLVKRQGGRMIESAGVHPEPADRPRPRQLKRAINQPAARTRAYQFPGYAEEGELALAWGSKSSSSRPSSQPSCTSAYMSTSGAWMMPANSASDIPARENHSHSSPMRL